MIRTNRLRRPRRPGFTLIELLVVIAILGVLAALSAAAYFKWIEARHRDNTELTLRAVLKNLQAHVKAVTEEADKEGHKIPAAVLTLAGGDTQRAMILWKNARLAQQLPMTYAEALTPPFSLAPNPKYVRLLQGKTANLATESSTCLLMALQQNRGGVSLDLDQLGAAITDSDGDGLKEFVDSWGTPLAFFRSPTGLPELSGSATANDYGLNPSRPAPNATIPKAARCADPLDPDGLLLKPSGVALNQSWYGTANRKTFETLFHPISPDKGKKAYFTGPVIVSAGNNAKFGLALRVDGSGQQHLDPTMTVSPAGNADAADNIYSFRLRLGAHGDAP